MVVRLERHVRRPDEIEDRQVRRVVELADAGAIGLADIAHEGGGIGDGALDDFAHGDVGGVGRQGGAAVGDELVEFEHGAF